MAYELKTALSHMGKKRLNFAFYRGEDNDQIVVSAKPPQPNGKVMQEVEKDCGKGMKRMLKGLCFEEGGTIIFATKTNPQGMYQRMIEQVFKARKCAAFLPVTLRKLGDNESDEVIAEEGDGAAPATPGKTEAQEAAEAPKPTFEQLQAQWEALKAQLLPGIKQGLANPALKAPLTKFVGDALANEKNRDYAAAIAAFNAAKAALANAGPAAPATQPAQQPIDRLKAQWDTLKATTTPRIRAGLARPDLKEPLTKLAGEALQKERAGAYADAIALFNKIDALLGGGASSEAQPVQQATVPPPPPPPAPPRKATPNILSAAMKKLAPLINQALVANPGEKAQILATVADFKKLVATDPEAAQASLVKITAFLRSMGVVLGSAAPSTPPSQAPATEEAKPADPKEAEFMELYSNLEPQSQEAMRIDANLSPEALKLTAKVRNLWETAIDQSDARNFDAAIATLKRLRESGLFAQMQQARLDASGGPAKGIVEKRKFLIERWKRIPGELSAELSKLEAEIEKQDPEEDALEIRLAMESYLDTLVDELQDEIDAAINSGDANGIKGLKTRVTSNEVIKLLLENPYVDGTGFQAAVLSAIDELEAKLAA